MSGEPLFDAVLFDLDGTLLDTTGAILKSLQYTLAHFAGEEKPIQFFRKFLGLPLIDVFSELVPDQPEEACQVYIKHNLAIHPEMVRGFPGSRETILRLKKEGLRVGLVTSKRRDSASLGINLAGLSGLMEVSVCHGETEKAKPDPEPVLRAIELLGYMRPRESGGEGSASFLHRVLMVGDSPFDVRSANNAKALLGKNGSGVLVKSAAVTCGAYPREALLGENPDYVIDRITQVLGVCGIENA